MPCLFVVATPIGNLEDITLRAIRTLREVKLIAAEDTRKTKILLNKYDIKTPMTSYYEHNKLEKLDYILNRMENDDIALVSEAGMPGISDPGYELIVAASERSIPIIPIPGPSVIITALVASGLPTNSFTYLGFLPHRAGERKNLLKSVINENKTLIIFESPHRLIAALNDILAILGDRRIAVCREMTKLHEEVFRGTISQTLKHFTQPRGEFTLVIEGKKEESKPDVKIIDIEKKLRLLRKSGVTAKEATARVAEETGLPRKEIYQTWIKIT